MTQLEQLMSQLRVRLSRLMAMRRESNERMADFAVADVSLFWLLNLITFPAHGHQPTQAYTKLAHQLFQLGHQPATALQSQQWRKKRLIQ